MCELTHGTAGERHGRGTGTACYVNRPLSSRFDMFFVDISAVEYETAMLFHNIGYQSLSDTVTHYGKMETLAVAL
jgi:hypothetical protein